MGTRQQNGPDATPESVLDELRLFRNALVEYANLASASMARKLSTTGWKKCMTLWRELSEEYGRLQPLLREVVTADEPSTWRDALTPPFNRLTASNVMRCAGIVSEAIGRLEYDVAAGLRGENGLLLASGTRMSIEVSPPAGNMAQSLDGLILHPSVLNSSRRLFLDGHYAQAIFEAFKTVNICVKSKTALQLDGEKLMAAVFNENKPLLLINQGSNKSDLDERKGFKFIYMGATTGIRNPKAHENVQQEDPIRTLRYLALASLLIEVAEQAKPSSDQTLRNHHE